MRLSFFFLFLDLDKDENHMYSGEYNFHICRHTVMAGKRNAYEPEEAVYHA